MIFFVDLSEHSDQSILVRIDRIVAIVDAVGVSFIGVDGLTVDLPCSLTAKEIFNRIKATTNVHNEGNTEQS